MEQRKKDIDELRNYWIRYMTSIQPIIDEHPEITKNVPSAVKPLIKDLKSEMVFLAIVGIIISIRTTPQEDEKHKAISELLAAIKEFSLEQDEQKYTRDVVPRIVGYTSKFMKPDEEEILEQIIAILPTERLFYAFRLIAYTEAVLVIKIEKQKQN